MDSTQSRRSITSLILAAGENRRLNGIVPSHFKPLMLVNGKPLLYHAIEHGIFDWRVSQTIVVVSPENAKPITELCDISFDYAVQPSPRGVVDAIARGVKMVMHPWLLILCADNTFNFRVGQHAPETLKPIFGARVDIKDYHSKRFTRFERHPDDGVRLFDANDYEPGEGCWVGPLLLSTAHVINALHNNPPPVSIVGLINAATRDGKDLEPLLMECEDFGLPEMLEGERP